jgi:predicted metalloendopeptidase
MGNFSVGLRASRLSDMDIFMPFVNWTHYFLSIMPEQMHDYIRSNPEIIIANPRFFTRLNQLLMETDPRVLMNVMLWRFADAWWLQLDDRFGTVRHDYMRRVVGIVEKPPRWKECAAVVNSAMPYATDSMYIRKFFKRNDFKLVQEMFTELRLEFIKSLWRSQWMDMKTKAYALEKVTIPLMDLIISFSRQKRCKV